MAKRTSRSATKSKSERGAPKLDASVRIALITGKDGYLRQGYTDRLLTALRQAHGEVELERFDGKTADVADVLDECRSFGLLATHKMVVVDDAADWVKGDRRPAVERYAENPPDSATLVLRSDTWHAGKLDKLIAKAGAVVKCDAPDARTAAAGLVRKARDAHERELAPATAAMIVERLGTDMGRLVHELDKLAAAAGPGAPITPELVRELTGVTREEQAWEIQRAMLSGDPDAAAGKLRDLLIVSRVPIQLLRWAVMDLARKMHGAARGLNDGVPAQELARSLKLWGDMQRGVMDAARRVGPGDAARFLEDAVTADLRGKTGFGDEVRALEVLAMRFARLIR